MSDKIRISLYAHEQHDEEPEWYADKLAEAGVPRDVALEWLQSNPLYEVEFVFDFNPADHKFEFVEVKF